MTLDFKLKISNDIVENLKGQCEEYRGQAGDAVQDKDKLEAEVKSLEEKNALLVKQAVEKPYMDDAGT